MKENLNPASGQNTKPVSKMTLLRDRVLRDVAVLNKIGTAWRLYFLLILNEGTMTSSYEQLGELLGANGRTARLWADRLEEERIATRGEKTRPLQLTLTEPHLGIATAPDQIVIKTAEPESDGNDPGLQRVVRAYTASKQFGGRFRWHIEDAGYGTTKTRP